MAISLSIEKKDMYIISAVLIFLIGAGFVIAYGSTAPNTMGHSINELERCPEGKILKISQGEWACLDDATGGSGSSLPVCTNNQVIKYSTSSSSWICSNDIDTDTKCNALGLCTKVYGTELCIGSSCRANWQTGQTSAVCVGPIDSHTSQTCLCPSGKILLTRINGECKVTSDTGSCEAPHCWIGAIGATACGSCCVCQDN